MEGKGWYRPACLPWYAWLAYACVRMARVDVDVYVSEGRADGYGRTLASQNIICESAAE